MKIYTFVLAVVLLFGCELKKETKKNQLPINQPRENNSPVKTISYKLTNDTLYQELIIYSEYEDSIVFHINCENYFSRHAASISGTAPKYEAENDNLMYDEDNTPLEAFIYALQTDDCKVFIAIDAKSKTKVRLDFEMCYSTIDGFCDIGVLKLVK